MTATGMGHAAVDSLCKDAQPLNHPWFKVAFHAIKHFLEHRCDDPNDGMLAMCIFSEFSRREGEDSDDDDVITDEEAAEALNHPGKANRFMLWFLLEYEKTCSDEEKQLIVAMKQAFPDYGLKD